MERNRSVRFVWKLDINQTGRIYDKPDKTTEIDRRRGIVSNFRIIQRIRGPRASNYDRLVDSI